MVMVKMGILSFCRISFESSDLPFINFCHGQNIDHFTMVSIPYKNIVLHLINDLLRPGWTGIMRDHLRRIIPHTTWYFKRSAFSHPDTRKRAAPLFKVFTTS